MCTELYEASNAISAAKDLERSRIILGASDLSGRGEFPRSPGRPALYAHETFGAPLAA
jgi:hypothetical protein